LFELFGIFLPVVKKAVVLLAACASLTGALDAQAPMDKGRLGIPLTAGVKPWTGDLDGMAERRMVRVLTTYSMSNLTVTPERQALVDFADPWITGVEEIVVTSPRAPRITSVDDLSGKDVFVRRSSSYYQSFVTLNERFTKEGKPLVTLTPAPEELEDEDLLEMAAPTWSASSSSTTTRPGSGSACFRASSCIPK
jgi:hypothetical protein